MESERFVIPTSESLAAGVTVALKNIAHSILGHLNHFNDTMSISQWMNPKLEYYIYMMHKTSYMYFFMYIYCVGGWRSKTKCTVTVHHVQNYRVPL